MMTQEEVVSLMQSSRNEIEWNNNADKVKRQCGGYPRFWFESIMLSGVANNVRNSWISTAIRGNLSEKMPENDSYLEIELLPPNEKQIAEIRKNQSERKQNDS